MQSLIREWISNYFEDPSEILTLAGRTMSYHHVYLLPIVVFPVVASVAQIAVVMKLDAARPTDDMHCGESKTPH